MTSCLSATADTEYLGSGFDNPINLVSYTSRRILTVLTNHRSPRVRERSLKNMTSSKT